MGGIWSYDTALDPNTANEHTQRMMRNFDRLVAIYGNDSGTVYVYTWTKPFDLCYRPLDRHEVVYFTLDRQNFVTVELCKRDVVNGIGYTIYPDSRYFEPLNDEKIRRLEYVGSKRFSRGNLSAAPAHFVNIAVQTMLNFGGYNFLVNNCQDYVDTYLDNIGLDGFNNVNRRQNIEERHPNYYTDYGKIVHFYACLISCVFFVAVAVYLILPWQAGGPSEIHQHSMPAVIKFIFMLLVTMVFFVGATAIIRSIVKRNVRTGYVLFSYYVTNTEITSLLTLIMICIMHIYNRNIILFYNWHLVLLSWVYIADSGHNFLRPMAPIFRYAPMLQTIGMIVYDYFRGFLALSWSCNPAIWILIAFPKQLSTTGQTTRHLAGLVFLSISVTLLYYVERKFEERSGKFENLRSNHVILTHLNTYAVFILFCTKFVMSLLKN
jgi:hypothetical protein